MLTFGGGIETEVKGLKARLATFGPLRVAAGDMKGVIGGSSAKPCLKAVQETVLDRFRDVDRHCLPNTGHARRRQPGSTGPRAVRNHRPTGWDRTAAKPKPTCTEQVMTIAEWKKLKLPMIWNVYKAGDDRAAGQPHDELDLSTEAPDGTHSVEADGWHHDRYLGTVVQLVRIHGVEVQAGQFVPEPTARACYAAQAMAEGQSAESVVSGDAETDHRYIEALSYDADKRRFQLSAGS